jgi:hypothetical protein
MTGSRENQSLPTAIRIALETDASPHNTIKHMPFRFLAESALNRVAVKTVLATLRALRLDPAPYSALSARIPKANKTAAQHP